MNIHVNKDAAPILLTDARRAVVVAALEAREDQQRHYARECRAELRPAMAVQWFDRADETATIIAIVKGETP